MRQQFNFLYFSKLITAFITLLFSISSLASSVDRIQSLSESTSTTNLTAEELLKLSQSLFSDFINSPSENETCNIPKTSPYFKRYLNEILQALNDPKTEILPLSYDKRVCIGGKLTEPGQSFTYSVLGLYSVKSNNVYVDTLLKPLDYYSVLIHELSHHVWQRSELKSWFQTWALKEYQSTFKISSLKIRKHIGVSKKTYRNSLVIGPSLLNELLAFYISECALLDISAKADLSAEGWNKLAPVYNQRVKAQQQSLGTYSLVLDLAAKIQNKYSSSNDASFMTYKSNASKAKRVIRSMQKIAFGLFIQAPTLGAVNNPFGNTYVSSIHKITPYSAFTALLLNHSPAGFYRNVNGRPTVLLSDTESSINNDLLKILNESVPTIKHTYKTKPQNASYKHFEKALHKALGNINLNKCEDDQDSRSEGWPGTEGIHNGLDIFSSPFFNQDL